MNRRTKNRKNGVHIDLTERFHDNNYVIDDNSNNDIDNDVTIIV